MSAYLYAKESLQAEPLLDQFGVPWVLLTDGDRRRPFNLTKPEVRAFISVKLTGSGHDFPSKTDLANCIERLRYEAEAKSERLQRRVRVGGDGRCIEVDLGTDTGMAIRVAAESVTIAPPRSCFVRSRGIGGLPAPGLQSPTVEQAQDIQREIGQTLNLSPDQVKLFMAYAIGCWMPEGPYPVLYVRGAEGSGKTMIAEALRAFVDPNAAQWTSLQGGYDKLVHDATWTHLQVYDNISTAIFSRRYSDLISQISTGTAIRWRQGGIGGDENILEITKPVVLNGTDDFITQPDLLSRVVKLDIAALEGRALIGAGELRQAILNLAPRVVSLMAHALSRALQVQQQVVVQTTSRMAHWVQTITACEDVLGWSPRTFQNLYEGNREEARADRRAGSSFVTGILQFMENRQEWQGSATQLCEDLTTGLSPHLRMSRDWPRGAVGVGAALSREESALSQAGIQVASVRSATTRTIRLVHQGVDEVTE
jgi:hypothetical protein